MSISIVRENFLLPPNVYLSPIYTNLDKLGKRSEKKTPFPYRSIFEYHILDSNFLPQKIRKRVRNFESDSLLFSLSQENSKKDKCVFQRIIPLNK